MRYFLSTLAFGAILLAPVAVRADDRDDHQQRQRQVYDREHQDRHEWNDNEQRAYRQYLQERNQPYRDWNRTDQRTQTQYWRWRHEQRPNDDRR